MNGTAVSSIPLIPGSLMWQTVFNATSAALIGSWFALLLCGIAIAQGYHYFNNCSDDNVWVIILVFVISALNILHVLFVCLAEYTYLVSSREDLLTRLMASWALVATIESHIVLATAVLLYYTGICCRLLTNKKIQKPVVVFLLISVLMHFGCGTATAVQMAENTSRLDIASFSRPVIIPMVVTQVVADVVVTTTLCFALPKPSVQGFSRTKDAIQTLMCFFVSRGIVTSLVAIVELFLLTLSYRNLWFIASEYTIGGLYTNSLLAALNARSHIRRRLGGSSDITTPASIPLNIMYRPNGSGVNATSSDSELPPSDGVKVEVFTIQKCDENTDVSSKV